MAGIEEEAKLIYSEKIADYYDGTRKEEPTFDEVIEEMTNRGYEFITKSETGDGVIGIELDKDKITVSANDSEKIKVILKKENVKYYIKAKSGYYEIKGESGGIELSDTPSDVEDLESGTGSTNNIEVSIDGTIVKSYELNKNIITLRAGDKTGNSKVTVTYGEFSAECDVKVVVRPTSDSVANSNNTFKTNYGTIDVIWLDTNNNVIDKPNSPEKSLTSNGESLIPVVFNSTTNEWDTIEASDSNWYNYEDTSISNEKIDTSKWANVKTKNDSYFVWIPRYAYRITYYEGYTEESDGRYVPKGEVTGYFDGLRNVENRRWST